MLSRLRIYCLIEANSTWIIQKMTIYAGRIHVERVVKASRQSRTRSFHMYKSKVDGKDAEGDGGTI